MYTFPGKTTRCLRCFSHKKNGDSHTAPPFPGASSVSRALRRLPQREWTRAFFKQRQTAEEKRKVRRQRPSFLKYGDKKPPRKTGTDNDSACRPRRRLRPTSFQPETFAPPSPRPLPRKRPHGTGDPTHDRSAPQNEAHPASRKKDRFKTVRERTECCFENCLRIAECCIQNKESPSSKKRFRRLAGAGIPVKNTHNKYTTMLSERKATRGISPAATPRRRYGSPVYRSGNAICRNISP